MLKLTWPRKVQIKLSFKTDLIKLSSSYPRERAKDWHEWNNLSFWKSVPMKKRLTYCIFKSNFEVDEVIQSEIFNVDQIITYDVLS